MKLKLLIAFTLLASIVSAQNKLVSYEYWFNNDYTNVQKVAISPTQTHVLNTNFDISALPNNVNVLNIRYKDGNGKYSSTLSKLFVKLPNAINADSNNLVSYEYWFNNDYANAQTITISSTQTHVLDTNLNISALPNNVNILNIRYKDENGKYSSTLSKLFVKLPYAINADSNNLVSYEYWFNNDYTNAQTVTIPPTQTHVLDTNLDISALPNNVNILNIRCKDENGKYSSTLSKLFVKLPYAINADSNNLVSYEYWFNNDYTNAQTVTIPPTQTHVLDTNLDISALPNNVNILNIRCKDENGKYSSTLSKLFVKLPYAQTIDNKLTDYIYWFDNDFVNATIVTLQQNVQTYNWVELLTLPSNMGGGNHEINIRFKDSLDIWSVPFAKTFFKEYEPRAEFYGMESELCLGTILGITPNAIDADSIYWNFGDGTEIEGKTATSFIQHFYDSAGTYTITATMKHVASGVSKDTTFVTTVHPSYGTFEITENYIAENFETIAIGSLPDGWTLKYDGTGAANQKVVDSPVKNGAKALQLEGAGSWSATLYTVPDSFPEIFTLEAWMQAEKILGGITGGLSITNHIAGSWGTYLVSVAFNNGNIIYDNTMSSTYVLQPYVINQWYHIKMINDFGNMTCKMFIDGQQMSYNDGSGNIIFDFPISNAATPRDITLFAGNASTVKIYFDDVKMYANDTISNFLEVDLSVCESELPYSFGTQSLTTDGTYTETFQTIHGCDSTVTMNFSVLPMSYGTDVQTACKSFKWIDGNTYTASNNTATYTLIGQAANGCDSIATLNLTINTVNVSVTQNDIVLSANATGAKYQWLDCNNEYAMISGKTSRSFTATQNGSYAVEVTQNNCIDTSTCYAVTTVGIVENTFENNINVYPNPTDGHVTIDMGKSLSEVTVSITDVSGKLLKQSTYKNTQMLELNLNVQTGIYLITINSENKRATIRLVKNRN
ncbi:MAG TPA: T9SS type A sorting domain-containing protein [Bacteroidales bacterium]|nr:T9SS type A sorting domain-containing protein [Bacteroidales bacterium]